MKTEQIAERWEMFYGDLKRSKRSLTLAEYRLISAIEELSAAEAERDRLREGLNGILREMSIIRESDEAEEEAMQRAIDKARAALDAGKEQG